MTLISKYFLIFLLYIVFNIFVYNKIVKKYINDNWIGVFVQHLIIVSVYAIFKSNGNTIAWALIIWIIVFFINSKRLLTENNENEHISFKPIIVIVIFIFTLQVYNYNSFVNDLPNLPFWDHKQYMQIAEGFYLTGNENMFGLKNLLFPDYLKFAEPYRSHDTWIISLGLSITNDDVLAVYQLFYFPIILFWAVYSIYSISIKYIQNKFYSVLFSFLGIFLMGGGWIRDIVNLLNITSINTNGYDPFSVVAYTKLAIPFAVLFVACKYLIFGNYRVTLLLLILIPILVQSYISLFAVVLLMALILLINRKIDLNYCLNFILPVGFFIIFYVYNMSLKSKLIPFSVTMQTDLVFLVVFLCKKFFAFIISYYNLFLILLIIIYKFKLFPNRIYGLLTLVYFSSLLVYSVFSNFNDSYQFVTNLMGIFVLVLLLYFTLIIKSRIVFCLFFLLSSIGFMQIVVTSSSNYFISKTRLVSHSTYSEIFFLREKFENIKNPIGIYYVPSILGNENENLWKQGTLQLKLLGKNLDVVNISTDSRFLNFSKTKGDKIELQISRNAFQIYRNLNKENQVKPEDFFNRYKFQYCISRCSQNQLPIFLQERITDIYFSKNSAVYYYFLNEK
jgi:hypothetical protein